MHFSTLLSIIAAFSLIFAPKAEAAKKNRKKVALIKNTGIAPGGIVKPFAQWNPGGQQDFSSMCLDAKGRPAVVFIGHNGERDTLKIARLRNGALGKPDTIPTRGDLYQPNLSLNSDGLLICTWSELEDGQWKLYSANAARPDKRTLLSNGAGNAVFAHSQADSKGLIHTVWQSFNGGFSEIHYRRPNGGDTALKVASHVAGDWEPRLAIGANDADFADANPLVDPGLVSFGCDDSESGSSGDLSFLLRPMAPCDVRRSPPRAPSPALRPTSRPLPAWICGASGTPCPLQPRRLRSPA